MKSTFELDLAQIRRSASSRSSTKRCATEIVCVLRYKNHYLRARGIRGETVAKEFLEHATE
jgi:hypothetical protein